MKELYVKPLVIFESFSLTQTIARDCGDTHSGTAGQSNHYNENTCEWDIGGFTFFFAIQDRCDDGPDEPGDDFDIETMCYNNPDGGLQVFSST